MIFSFGKKNYNWFHSYFKSLYPSMYEDMMSNMNNSTSKYDAPPTPTMVAPSAKTQPEKDRADVARQNKYRAELRLAGKVTINGMPIQTKIPSLDPEGKGMSSAVHNFHYGSDAQPNAMTNLGGMGLFNKMNESSHTANINALIESEGKSGAVGYIYDPITNRHHSISLSVSDLSEGVSNTIESLTGSSTGTMRKVTGTVPDVLVFNGTVYNTQDGNDYRAFLDAFEASGPSGYENYVANNVSQLSDSDDGGNAEGSGAIIQSDKVKPLTEAYDPLIEANTLINEADEREKTRLEANKKEAAERYDDKSGDAIADLYKDMEKDDKPGGQFSGGDWGFNTGGKVNSGFIGGKTPFEVSDKQSVADNLTIPAKDGGFVMNAPSMQERPEEFQTMLADAGVEMIDVSAGEYYFKPEDVAKIGLDKLQAFNDRGKPEVSNRIARSGGFINGYAAGDEVNENAGYGDIPDDFFNKVSNFAQKKRQRGEIDTFINELTDQEALSLLFLTETYAGKDPIEHMQRIGDVVLNRASSSNDDFKMQNTIKDVLTFKKSRKKGNKPMYQFDGLEPTSLHKRLTEVTEGGARYAFEKAYAAAENTLNADPDLEQYRLPKNVLYYQKLDPTEDNWMDNNPLLAPLHQFGDHMFYEWFPTADENLFPAREYP